MSLSNMKEGEEKQEHGTRKTNMIDEYKHERKTKKAVDILGQERQKHRAWVTWTSTHN